MSHRACLASPLLALLMAGCAASGSYPSLLPRAAESTDTAEPAVAPPVTAVADPALDAAIADALTAVEERSAAFDAAASRAEQRVAAARGASAGSDAWLDAQLALADLDTLRASTLELSTGLEDTARQRALSLAPDYPALSAAVERIRAVTTAQAGRITALQAQLAPA